MAITLLLWVGFLQMWHGENTPRPGPSRKTVPVFVADITDMHEVRWADEFHTFHRRSRLQAGTRLELKSGLVEITFRDGAVVLVEGPAQFNVDTRGSGILTVGKLTAHVPPRASGFIVRTPVVNVIDKGTEFGLEVDEQTARVDVFSGQVDAEFLDADGEVTSTVRLTEGRAVRFDAARQHYRQVAIDATRFPLRLPSRAVRPTAANVVYRYADGHQPGPTADRTDSNRRKLTDGLIGKANWEEGHWVGVLDAIRSGGDDGRPQPAIEFEFLGESALRELAFVRVTYIVDHDSGIHAPDELRITLSEDAVFDAADRVIVGKKFDDRRDPPGAPNGAVRTVEIDLDGARARFALLQFANDGDWTFISEVAFHHRNQSASE